MAHAEPPCAAVRVGKLDRRSRNESAYHSIVAVPWISVSRLSRNQAWVSVTSHSPTSGSRLRSASFIGQSTLSRMRHRSEERCRAARAHVVLFGPITADGVLGAGP